MNTVLHAVRGWLNGLIGGFTWKDVQEAIDEDRDLWNVTPGSIKNTGMASFASGVKYFHQYYDMITTDLLLNWLKEDHYDLHVQIVSSRKGIIWFDKQVKQIKHQIKEM